MSDVIKTKWLSLVIMPKDPKKKTREWTVCSGDYGPELGVIKWYAPWRKYCFFPKPDTLFEQDCLSDIAGQLVILTTAYKFDQKKANEKA